MRSEPAISPLKVSFIKNEEPGQREKLSTDVWACYWSCDDFEKKPFVSGHLDCSVSQIQDALRPLDIMYAGQSCLFCFCIECKIISFLLESNLPLLRRLRSFFFQSATGNPSMGQAFLSKPELFWGFSVSICSWKIGNTKTHRTVSSWQGSARSKTISYYVFLHRVNSLIKNRHPQNEQWLFCHMAEIMTHPCYFSYTIICFTIPHSSHVCIGPHNL